MDRGFFLFFFSMGFFDWKTEGDGRIVSPYIWIYFVVAIFLTVITFAAFYLFGGEEEGRCRVRPENWASLNVDRPCKHNWNVVASHVIGFLRPTDASRDSWRFFLLSIGPTVEGSHLADKNINRKQ